MIEWDIELSNRCSTSTSLFVFSEATISRAQVKAKGIFFN